AGDMDQAAETAPAGALPESVLGTTWEWVGTVTPLERFTVADPSRYTITLNADGSVAALFDCNRGRGSYEASEHRIQFGPFATTRMACPEDTQDFQFISQLERVTSYFVQDGQLFLEAPYDSGTMRFRAADSR
ncbi:MAG: META domain-containing protein, partial [Chromatiales bacterium]